MTMIAGAGRMAAMQAAMTEAPEPATSEPHVITAEMAAEQREGDIEALAGSDPRKQMFATGHTSRPEAYGAITNEVLAKAGFGAPLTGQDATLQDAIAHVRANPFDMGVLAVALAKETEHAGLVAALDLPANYKNVRGGQMAMGPESGPAKAVEAKLKSDPQAMAALQANADLGMEAAREMKALGMNKEQLFARSPDIAKAYASDPAFHEGFDAYQYATSGELTAIHSRLDQESIANHRALANMYFPA